MDIFIIILLGLCFGSFVTMAAHRMPEKKDMVMTRSHCPNCLHVLGIIDLFPFLSWVFTRGKCRYCRVKIHWKYPAIELAQALFFTLIYLKYGLSFSSILLMLLSVALLLMIVIDLEHTIIPDSLQLVMAGLGLIFGLAQHHGIELFILPLALIATGLLLRAFFTWWKGQEALGLGDVKFLGVAGLWLNSGLVMPFFFLAGVIGIVTALLWKKIAAFENGEFPFGPALALSLFFCLLLPELPETGRAWLVNLLVEYLI